jgi:hypothetical protein
MLRTSIAVLQAPDPDRIIRQQNQLGGERVGSFRGSRLGITRGSLLLPVAEAALETTGKD